AEDGIRDDLVTGVQTCALPIWAMQYSDHCIIPNTRSPSVYAALRDCTTSPSPPARMTSPTWMPGTYVSMPFIHTRMAGSSDRYRDRKSVGRERVKAGGGGEGGQ